MQNHKNIWIRIAGNAESIRAATKTRWRCFLGAAEPMIPLKSWHIEGSVTKDNFVHGTNPHKDHLGLSAWMDAFGDITFTDEDVAVVTLRTPTHPRPTGANEWTS